MSKKGCECGKDHIFPIQEVHIGEGAIGKLPGVIDRLSFSERCLLMADENTYEVAGREVAKIFKEASIDVNECILSSDGDSIVADERTVFQGFEAFTPEDMFIVGVGSGTINDIARYVGFKTRRPHLGIGTAASMDGYASSISPLVIGNFKISYNTMPTSGIIGDTDILASAPREMTAAGFADLMGKYTANADWVLGSELRDEYRCEWIWQYIEEPLTECINNIEEISNGSPQAIGSFMEGLINSGVSIFFAESSRPASGAEHLISHFLEIKGLAEGKKPLLHGTKVGVGTLVIARVYEKLFNMDVKSIARQRLASHISQDKDFRLKNMQDIFGDAWPKVRLESHAKLEEEDIKSDLERVIERWDIIREKISWILRPVQELEGSLKTLGGPVSFRELGVSHKEVMQTLLYAKDMRNRYTILDLAYELGILESVVEECSKSTM